jgi:hypothetical protein
MSHYCLAELLTLGCSPVKVKLDFWHPELEENRCVLF